MKKLIKILSAALIVFTVAAGVSSCTLGKDVSTYLDADTMAKFSEIYKKSGIPDPQTVISYSESDIDSFISSIDEQKLIENWGEPLKVNQALFKVWPVEYGDQIKYLVAQSCQGEITALSLSEKMDVTVVDDGFCILSNNYVCHWMPTEDAFGNKIEFKAGDKLVFETFGDISSYPYSVHVESPFAYKVVGHLSGEELDKLREDIEKYGHIPTASEDYIIETII